MPRLIREPLFAATLLILGLIIGLGAATARAQIFHPTYFVLENGLQVVLIEDHRAPVVHHMVWYKVGAADEQPGVTGVAHYLEHLMFKGTPSLPAGEFSNRIARVGGRENAFTTADYTAYYQTVARDQLDMVMAMEADRMVHLEPQQAAPELQVVLQERLMRVENNPAALFDEQYNAAQFLASPYGRPVIGWPQEVEKLKLEDAMLFYRTYYAPNNAILVVAGDVKPAELRRLAEKHYGSLPMRPVPPRLRSQEPPQLAARRLSMGDARVSEPSLRRSYLAPSRSAGASQHAIPLTVLAEILNGPTGRLHTKLVSGDGPAVSAGAWYDEEAVQQRVFAFSASPKPGHKLPEVEAALDAVIQSVLEDGVSDQELADAKAVLRAQTVYARDSLSGAAQIFGQALATGLSVEDVENWPKLIDAVTREQISAAAHYVFDERKSVTGYLLPKEQS
ncbi:MAG TPA: pitrilysin family protein [Ferrovibrio sp.]|uniref:M16 family metallopeptidase n=1 Tax=Ferrovibrio sp. TaxID=1917215 RepID=UPI002ED2921E